MKTKEKILIIENENKFKAYVVLNSKNKIYIGNYNNYEDAKNNALQYIN